MARGTILVLVGPEYEDLEVWYPKLRLEEAGYDTPLAGLGEPIYKGKHGYPCPVDGKVRDLGEEIQRALPELPREDEQDIT